MDRPGFQLRVPPRCRGCKKPISGYEPIFTEKVFNQGVSIPQALDDSGIIRTCCRAHFLAPDFYSEMAPGRRQILKEQNQLAVQKSIQTVQDNLRRLKLPNTIFNDPDAVELAALLKEILGIFEPTQFSLDEKSRTLTWGGKPDEALLDRIANFYNNPEIPEWVVLELDKLQRELEGLEIDINTFIPEEAFIIVDNVKALNQRLKLNIPQDLMVPDQSLELKKMAIEALVNKGKTKAEAFKMVTRRPIRLRPLFSSIRQKQTQLRLQEQEQALLRTDDATKLRLDHIRSNAQWNQDFEAMIEHYRQILGRIRPFLPGDPLETIFERASRIQQGEINESLNQKLARVIELSRKFGLKSNQLTLFMKTFEIAATLQKDVNVSIEQILDSTGRSTVQSERSSQISDPVGSNRTTSVMLPVTGLTTIPQRFKVTEIGK